MVFISIRKPDIAAVRNCLQQSKVGDYNYSSKYVGATADQFPPLVEASVNADGYVVDRTRVRVGTGLQTYKKCRDFVKQWGHFQLGWAFVDPATPIQKGGKVCVAGKSLLLWTLNPLEVLYVKEEEQQQQQQEEEEEAGSAGRAGAGGRKRSPDGGSGGQLSLTPTRGGQRALSSALGAFEPNFRSAQGARRADSKAGQVASSYRFAHGTLRGHMLAGEESFAVEWREEDDSVWYEIVSFSKPANFLSAATYPIARYLQKEFAKQSIKLVTAAVVKLDSSTT
eukprot:jgi/Mesen1/8838/ME000053S08244